MARETTVHNLESQSPIPSTSIESFHHCPVWTAGKNLKSPSKKWHLPNHPQPRHTLQVLCVHKNSIQNARLPRGNSTGGVGQILWPCNTPLPSPLANPPAGRAHNQFPKHPQVPFQPVPYQPAPNRQKNSQQTHPHQPPMSTSSSTPKPLLQARKPAPAAAKATPPPKSPTFPTA